VQKTTFPEISENSSAITWSDKLKQTSQIMLTTVKCSSLDIRLN